MNEYRDLTGHHNERLEFLGDSVLGLAVADYLYHRLPSYPEGQLSQLRSRLVDAASCAQYLQKLGLSRVHPFRKRGKDQRREDESLYFGRCIRGARRSDLPRWRTWRSLNLFSSAILRRRSRAAIGSPPRNYKAELQDYSQKKFQKTPIVQSRRGNGSGSCQSVSCDGPGR